jgi:hypothetical protein
MAEGYRVVGFDLERHAYGDHAYPAQLVLQDVLTIHGSQFKDAALIVASPPCQEYSYMAMPWSKGKQIAKEYRDGTRDVKKLTALFDACFRIQREASAAAGHPIPLVVENVRGAQEWVGRAKWHYGSFYLWGDVPALMPMTRKSAMKGCVGTINGSGQHREQSSWDRAVKSARPNQRGVMAWTTGHLEGYWESNTTSGHGQNPDGRKGVGCGSASWQRADERHPNDPRNFYSRSPARKAAAALIAKIPLPLSRHIARVYYPYV